MPKKKKRLLNKMYHPDYRALYPGLPIPPKVLSDLKKSDRKMEYIEHDLKHSRVRRGADGEIISVTPPREDSLERMLEANNQFAVPAPSPEELFMATEEVSVLHQCLDTLAPDDRALIEALFYDGFSEKEYGKTIDLSQTGVSWRKRKILCGLKKLLNF